MTDEIKAFLEDLYNDYKTYKGEDRIAEDEWLLFATDTYFFLQYLSSGKFSTIIFDEELELAITLAIINIADIERDLRLRKALSSDNLGISSESVSSHSITYSTTRELVDEFEKEAHTKKVDIARMYLQTTGIFYRGL